MMKRKGRCVAALVLVVSVVWFITACDQTVLEGEIFVKTDDIQVGKAVPLMLEIPPKLDGIYRVMWGVLPRNAGEIYYGEEIAEIITREELKQYYGDIDNVNMERIALFYPAQKGKCIIEVSGFYKQTNPQGITEIEIMVKD